MYRRIITILAIFFLSFVLAGCDSFRWQRYRNKEYRFSILLPRGWKKEEPSRYNIIISVKAPLGGAKERLRANINVVVSELPLELSLATFFELNKEETVNNSPGYKSNILESEIFSGGRRGMVLAFDNTFQEGTVKVISACWKKDKYVYVVTGVCQAEKYNIYKPIFRRVLSSLRLY